MPINTIEYAQILQNALDKKAVATLCSGWMEANAGQVIYSGGKYIKIPKMSLTGLMDYDRDAGYKKGAVTLEYATLEMTMDRGTSFVLDAMDVDESNFIASATSVAGEFQRTQVIPEIDAYRYSKIAALTTDTQSKYSVDTATVFDALYDDIAKVRDTVGDSEEIVVSIQGSVKSKIEKLEKFAKYFNLTEFKQGEITTRIKSINDAPLLSVPSSRMKSGYVFADGETEGQKQGGFRAAQDATDINWIVAPRRAIIAVSKQDKMKIFDPDTYQDADAWFVGYRKYHDLWIKDSMLDTIVASVAPAVA